MKLRNIILTSAALITSSAIYAQSEKEYIQTFGMMMFERSGLSELKLNPEEMEIFITGMKEANAGKALPENMAQIGQKMMDYLKARAEKNMSEEAKKTEAAAADFWKKIESDEKISKSPTGLAYEIIEKGTGDLPSEDSTVTINYTGTLTDGTVFDTSKTLGKPVPLTLSQVIPGFREGLQKIGKGGKVKLYIPAKLGYGNQALPGIPAGSTLIFDVEVLDISDAPVPAATPVNAQ